MIYRFTVWVRVQRTFSVKEKMDITSVWWRYLIDSQGRRECVWVPVEKIVSCPLAKADQLKIYYTKSERLTLSCTVTWPWSERVNVRNRQVMMVPEIKKKHTQHCRAPGPLPDRRAPVICTGFPPPPAVLSALWPVRWNSWNFSEFGERFSSLLIFHIIPINTRNN
jgi:hypothetical protein